MQTQTKTIYQDRPETAERIKQLEAELEQARKIGGSAKDRKPVKSTADFFSTEEQKAIQPSGPPTVEGYPLTNQGMQGAAEINHFLSLIKSR